MRRGLFPFFLVGLLLLLCQPAGAQMSSDPGPAIMAPGTHMLFGQVRLAGSNAPVDHVQITLRKFSGEMISMRPTNSNGDFTIAGINAGSYVIVAEKDGFEPAQEDVEVAAMGSTMVNLVMRPLERARAPAGTVSARLLAIPQKAKDAYAKGVAELYDKKSPEASLPYFQLALKEAPEFYEADFQIGVAYRTLGQNEQAEAAFRKTLELSKGQYLGTRFRLASVLVDLTKYSEAESMAREGLASLPNSWLGNFELGRALIGLGRPAEAEKSVRKALELNPGLAKGYLLLANIHIARKDPADVVKDLDDYLRLDPKSPQSDRARRMREQMQQQVNQAKKASPAGASPPQ
jgi:Flp pilus assembly protein TadD